jgi:hypothetical protein
VPVLAVKAISQAVALDGRSWRIIVLLIAVPENMYPPPRTCTFVPVQVALRVDVVVLLLNV